MVITCFIFIWLKNKDIREYDNWYPPSYNPIEVRGSSYSSDEMEIFYRRFTFAMLEYKNGNYAEAIIKLENIKPAAQELFNNKKSVSLIRDYYFFLGVSHLALSRRGNYDLTIVSKRQHLNDAIEFLSKSFELSLLSSLGDTSPYRYFLGLAYGLAGFHAKAIYHLKMIKLDSDYYYESLELIDAWSK